MSILGNYIDLKAGVPKKLKISKYYLDTQDMKDPTSGETKAVNRLVCMVTREDGKEGAKTFSITSEKLAQMIMPGLKKDLHLEKEVRITMTGKGFLKEFSLEWI